MTDKILEITITLVEGKGLLAGDYTGKSDPYVIFQLGENKYTSKSKTQTLNPTWNETFTFKGKFKETDILHFKVWDWDLFSRDGAFYCFLTKYKKNLVKLASTCQRSFMEKMNNGNL
jgi:Ca2+-dependent lipid-binding protein